MKRFSRVALVWLLVASSAIAGEPVIVLLGNGQAWYSAGDGSPTVIVKTIVNPPGGQPTPPTPGPGPGPTPTPDDLVTTIAGKAAEVDDVVGAKLLAQTYNLLAEQIAAGKVKPDVATVDEVMTSMLDKTFELIPGDSSKWQGFRRYVADEIAARNLKDGRFTAAQWTEFFASVSKGLEKSTEGQILEGLIAELIKALVPVLLKALLDIINNFANGAGS